MKRRMALGLVIGIVIVLLVWLVISNIRGPSLPGYKVSQQPLVQTVVATGRVAAVSRAQIGSPITGVVLERQVKDGDRVQVGDVLAILRADDLEATLLEARAVLAELQESTRPQAEASLHEAEEKLLQASREVKRRRVLFEQRAVSHEEMEQAVRAETIALTAVEQARLTVRSLTAGNPTEAMVRARVASAEAQLAKTIIRAEVAGTVLTRDVEPGDLVQPGRTLFEIARNDDTEIVVPLDEKNLEFLSIGQSAMSVADAYPSRPFPAKVNFIAPRIDPQRGTVDIHLDLISIPDFLRQDMTVSVNVETGRRDKALVVPNDALIAINGDQADLWVVVNGHTRRRKVQLGLRGLTQSEVIDGVQDGDWVLTDGYSSISEGDRVQVKASSSSAGPSSLASKQKDLPVSLD